MRSFRVVLMDNYEVQIVDQTLLPFATDPGQSDVHWRTERWVSGSTGVGIREVDPGGPLPEVNLRSSRKSNVVNRSL